MPFFLSDFHSGSTGPAATPSRRRVAASTGPAAGRGSVCALCPPVSLSHVRGRALLARHPPLIYRPASPPGGGAGPCLLLRLAAEPAELAPVGPWMGGRGWLYPCLAAEQAVNCFCGAGPPDVLEGTCSRDVVEGRGRLGRRGIRLTHRQCTGDVLYSGGADCKVFKWSIGHAPLIQSRDRLRVACNAAPHPREKAPSADTRTRQVCLCRNCQCPD